jgi:hypothetical protein
MGRTYQMREALMKSIIRFYNRIKKLWGWNKLLWKDYDWDYSYLLRIMRYKLELMEPSIRNGYAISADKTADEIKKTIELLDLLIEDDFLENTKKLDDIYGNYSFIKLDNGNTSLERSGVTPENEEEYKAQWKEANRLDDLAKKKVQNDFFRQLKKYEKWWD